MCTCFDHDVVFTCLNQQLKVYNYYHALSRQILKRVSIIIIEISYNLLCKPGSHILSLLLPTESGEREELAVWSILVAILPPCQNMKIIALQPHKMNIVG